MAESGVVHAATKGCTHTDRRSVMAATHALSEREMLQHLQEAADVVAHELPQDGQQQLVLAVEDVDAADVHQRQRQHPPRDAHHLQVKLPLLVTAAVVGCALTG